MMFLVTCLLLIGAANSWKPKYIPYPNSIKKIGIITAVVSLQASLVGATTFKNFVSPDGAISFAYPDDFAVSEKPVRTHNYEVYIKSEKMKGYNEGITVDKVKIDNILKFATPKELGGRVIRVEKAKDGVFDATLVQYGESATTMDGIHPSYDLEYKVESKRGDNYYAVKTSIIDKNLYVFTVQCSQANYPSMSQDIHTVLDSIKVKSPSSSK